jgi:Methyltransferase domain
MRSSFRSPPLLRYFERNDGHLIDKWMHYFGIYERHFDPFRRSGARLLEIGISHGGSLQMWRSYLGRRATIVGVDIEPRVASLAEPGIDIHVGSQSDPEFLRGLIDRYGGFDIVIDDGSHWFADQRVSFDVLWPAVSEGGVYLVEDVHTSYLASYEGGRGVPQTFVASVKDRIDDLHGFWIDGQEPVASASASASGPAVNGWTTTIAGIHVYDSVVVFDKATHDRPVRRMTGRPAFDTLYDHPVDRFIDDDHRAQLASLNSPIARVRRTLRDPRSAAERLRRRVSGSRVDADSRAN